MLLDVPFHPDPSYLRLLAELAPALESVHVGLNRPEAADARNPLRHRPLEETLAGLATLPEGLARYALLNARFQAPERCLEPASLRAVASLLERLADEAALTGIVVADGYFLQALGRAAPRIAARLEAVPSVNCAIDTPARAAAWLALVGRCGFRPPSRLVLDRSLNRDRARLAAVVRAIRERSPGLRLLLLANEGCLPHCPYRPAHESHLALARMPGQGDRTFALNRDFGCVAELLAEPWRLFTSPFLRPEDVDSYDELVDGVKICGRERGGARFLSRAVRAYAGRAFSGNLLALLDTLGEFEDRWEVRNETLPQDFARRVERCAGEAADCAACGECSRLAGAHLKIREAGLPDLRARGARGRGACRSC
ncbi:MAG: hypothetical protein AB7D51_14095 [Desulfovibrionaceae bacterium]